MRTLFLASLFYLWSSTGAAGVLTLAPERDNTLFQDPEGELSSGSGPALFAGYSGQGLARRALLRFDVAGRLPSGARVDSVALVLWVANASNEIPRQFTLHRVLRDWGEGSSFATGGMGAPAADGDATWTHASYPASPWLTVGGEFEPAASASRLVAGIGAYAWTGSLMTADVEEWRARPAANFGWLVRGEETGVNTARRFDSRESDEPQHHPALIIFFTEATALHSDTWGSVKTRYR